MYSELENVPLCVFAMIAEDYAVMLMYTYGKNKRAGNDKFREDFVERVALK